MSRAPLNNISELMNRNAVGNVHRREREDMGGGEKRTEGGGLELQSDLIYCRGMAT